MLFRQLFLGELLQRSIAGLETLRLGREGRCWMYGGLNYAWAGGSVNVTSNNPEADAWINSAENFNSRINREGGSEFARSIRTPLDHHPRMSIIKSVLIYGCGEGSISVSLAMALARKSVHGFACWLSLSEMSQLNLVIGSWHC